MSSPVEGKETSEIQLIFVVHYKIFIFAVTWNGTWVEGPVLIFHDEVLFDPENSIIGDPYRNGSLTCSADVGVGWGASALNHSVHPDYGEYNLVKQMRNSNRTVSRLSFNRKGGLINDTNDTDIRPLTNGLWHCRRNYDQASEVNIGLYARGGGTVALSTTDTPGFHLGGLLTVSKSYIIAVPRVGQYGEIFSPWLLYWPSLWSGQYYQP